jgi:protein CpxP
MNVRLFLFTALAFCMGTQFTEEPKLFGQPAQGAGVQALEQMAKQLKLTPQQKARLLPILAAEAPQLKAIKNDTSLSGVQKIERMRALHMENDPQVRAILTPQQYQKLQEMRQKEIEQAVAKKLSQH